MYKYRCMMDLAKRAQSGPVARMTPLSSRCIRRGHVPCLVHVRGGIAHKYYTSDYNNRETLMNKQYRHKSSEKQASVLTNKEAEGEEKGESNSFVVGNALLLGVAFLWGSYTPMLKVLFELEGGPTPECVAWIRGTLQAIILCSVALVGSSLSKPALSQDSSEMEFSKEKGETGSSNDSFKSNNLGRVPIVLLAAAEIGLYNSLGTLLQTEGISVRCIITIVVSKR